MHYHYYEAKKVGDEFYFITCCDLADNNMLTVYKMKDGFCGEFDGKNEDYNPLKIDHDLHELLSYVSKYLGDVVYTVKVHDKPYETFKNVSQFFDNYVKTDNKDDKEDVRTLCEDIISRHKKLCDDLISQHKQLEQDIDELMDKLNM